MVEPTLEDDIASVRGIVALCARRERDLPLACEAFERLDRVSAAVRDRAHLEKGAQLLQYIFDCAEVDVDPGELDVQRTQAWLEAERARRQGTDGK